MNPETTTLHYALAVVAGLLKGITKVGPKIWAYKAHAKQVLPGGKLVLLHNLEKSLVAPKVASRDLSGWLCAITSECCPKLQQPQVQARLLHEALWVASQVQNKPVEYLGQFSDTLPWPSVLAYLTALEAHLSLLEKKARFS